MIKAVYHRNQNKITLEGHAYSGEPGYDLICAAASVLIYTIAASVNSMQEHEHVSDALISLDSGNGVVSCEPYEQFKGAITLVFDSICAGFEILAANYPENIAYDLIDT